MKSIDTNRSSNPIIEDNEALLNAMMEDMAKQDSIFKPTAYWDKYVKRIVTGIRRAGLGSFRRNWLIGKGFADVSFLEPSDVIENRLLKHFFVAGTKIPIISEVVSQYRRVRDWHINQEMRAKTNFFRILLNEMGKGILVNKRLPYTLLGNTPDVIEIEGQKYSTLYIELAHRIQVVSRSVPLGNVKRVFEIGGGFGTNAHLLLHLYPSIRKVLIVDIPPILYVATQYLRAFFGDAVRDYKETRDSKELSFANDDSLEIFMIPPWQLHTFKCRDIDLFWNAASFQEMERDVVLNYIAAIDKMQPQWTYLYTLKHGIIRNLVGQKSPIDEPFLKESFAKACSLNEVNDELNPYYSLCIHLIGKRIN